MLGSTSLSTAEDYDYLLKLVVIGERSVGKSAITQRYVDNVFNPNISATLGYDFIAKTVPVTIQGLERKVKLQLWDTGGSEQFHSVTKQFYRGAQGALIFYSITDQVSFSKVDWWINDLREVSPDCSIILIGNKSDLEASREVLTVEGANLALSYGTQFTETSAQDGKNVDEAFRKLITNAVLEIMDSDEEHSSEIHVQPLSKSPTPPPEKGCCH